MLAEGVYLAPSAFETWFVSSAHDPASLEKTVRCAGKSLRSL
jgi:glutamate-1-semialdehyde 2,1-aminomutase